MIAYLLCFGWLLKHLGFLCLECLAKLDDILSLKRINMLLFVIVSIFTVHMPNFVIVGFLFVLFRTMIFIFVATNCSFITLRNKILNMGIGIIFPSLPVLIL